MKKMTKRDYFNQLLSNYPLKADEVAFINHELELLARKNETNTKKLTANQVSNEKLKNDMLDVMEPNVSYSVTDVQKMLGLDSNQKASALLRQLVENGKVVRSEEKRKAYFTKVVE